MNFLSRIRNNWFKLMANQLRMPSGLLANITGNSMNKSNKLLYHLTLGNMEIKEGDIILEIGFGNGEFFPKVYALAKNLTLTGIDHSPEMVREARRRNRDLHESGILKTFAGSSASMPFDNDHFDKIYCINVIYFWENPALHLKEIYRVLKPGGHFCAGFRPKENLEKFPFAKFGFTLYSVEEFKILMKENGFKFVTAKDGKELARNMNQEKSPFESLCIVCQKVGSQ